MITLPVQSDPPRWMEAVVSSLLPPACREPVLGDLHERFLDRGHLSWLGYLADAVTTVPFVLRTQLRRMARAVPACAAAYSGGLRSRAEQLQTQVWVRNVSGLISSVAVTIVFLVNAQSAWRFNDTVSLAMTAGFVIAAWRCYGVLGRSRTVPVSLTHAELLAFHRRELTRQMDVGRGAFVLGSLPAVALILYSLAIPLPGFNGGPMLLAALALQNGAITWVQWLERRQLQRELDRLDEEAGPA